LKELTIEESVKLHRELWGWLADNPEMSKGDWSGWEDLLERHPGLIRKESLLASECFACYVARGNCDNCILEWPGIGCCSGGRYGDGKGLFSLWENTKFLEAHKEFLEARRELAAQIRDLPVRNRSHREEAGK